MDREYYIISFSFFFALLMLMFIEENQVVSLLYGAYSTMSFTEFFLNTIPEKSILSYVITSIFGATAIVFGNVVVNQGRYQNQVGELKRLLYFLIDNQITSVERVVQALVTVRSLLREIYSLLSGEETIARKRDENLVRLFYQNIAFLKRTIDDLKKDSLYEKLLFERRSIKAEAGILVDSYFRKLRSLLIDLETLTLSNFPDSNKEIGFQWREVRSIYCLLDNAITQLSLLICKAEMCKVILLNSSSDKNQVVKEFHELISLKSNTFDYQRRELISLKELKEISDFVDKKCFRQKREYSNWNQLISLTSTEIQDYQANSCK